MYQIKFCLLDSLLKTNIYVGRLHREHQDKEKIIVYDYLDNMKVLEKMYSTRLKGDKIAGYEVIE